MAAVQAESPRRDQALAELCQHYWYPLYAYVRQRGHSRADAEDLVQGFFARLLERNQLAVADPSRGRFRTFLLVALKRYMANEWNRAHALRRGGGLRWVALDFSEAEMRYGLEPAHQTTPESLYERHWAQTLLDHVMQRLQRDYTAGGKGALFEALRGSLGRRQGEAPYAEVASRLGMTEAAVKMAVQRLRARYRQTLREEIARTVGHVREVDEEIRHLFATFNR